MRLGIFIFLLTTFCSLSSNIYAFSDISEVDSVNSILNGDAIFDLDYTYSILKNYTYKNDSPLTNHVHSIIEEAQKSNNIEKEFKGYFFLGQLYLQKYKYTQAETYFLKAQKKAKTDREYIITVLNLAEIKMEINLYLEALEFLSQAKQRTNQTEDVTLLARILLKEGFCYTELHKYEIAENQYNKAYSIIENNALRELYGEIFKHRGHLYFKQLNYLNALANFYKGLEFFEADTVIPNYAIILDYLGQIYFYQGNYSKAIEYFNDAEILYNRLHNIKKLGLIHYQIALSNLNLKNNDEVKKHLKKGMEYFSMFDSETGKISINLAYVKLFNQKNNPDSSVHYINKIAPLISNLTLDFYKFDFYKCNADYNILIHNTDSAVYFAKMAASIEHMDILQQIDCQNILADAYSFAGNYKKAYEYKNIASILQDSVNKTINSYEIKILQSELELSQKKVVIENLNNEREIQNKTLEENQATLEKQKDFIYLGIVVTLAVIIIAFLLAAFLYQKRKDNKILSARNKQIAQHKEEIELQSQHLQEVNDELEKLSIIARETDNGIKIMNAVGRVIWVNEGYTRMHGYCLDELQTIEKHDLLGEQASINIQQLVNVWYGDKKPITFESLNKTKDEKNIWVQTTLTPILDENGKIDRMIAIDSNITAIKFAENEIFVKNQDITSSISYAKRIQEAMMTPFNILTEQYKNSFCFYKPKSIVSGDFYWMAFRQNRLVVVCSDSTGHGVPGAFMSMIGMSFLNKIVMEKGFVSPDTILNRMRMNIINHLRQDGSQSLAGDGMDMSVITLDKQNKTLEYAGAMNPITIVRNNELIELKPDRMPVGFFDNEDRSFTSQRINLEPNDQIYLYTDGYYDQFGGETGSKMKSHRFKDILKRASQEPVELQRDFFEKEFDDWKGDSLQIDDVLIMGINIS